MRRRALLAGLLVLSSLVLAVPRASGVDFSCPDLGKGTTVQPNPEKPSSGPRDPWSFGCSYEKNGFHAGSITVFWFVPGQNSPDCPVVHVNESPRDGSVASSERKSGVGWNLFPTGDPSDLTHDDFRPVAAAMMAAVADRAAPCEAAPASPFCAISGRVTDHEDQPVPRAKVLLEGPSFEKETSTDDDGRYEFRDYAQPIDLDPDRDPVQVELFLEQPGVFEFNYAEDPARLRSAPFLVNRPTCTQDFAPDSDYAEMHPTEREHWAALWALFRRLQRAFEFAQTQLGQPLDDLPITVTTFCTAQVYSHCAEDNAYHVGKVAGDGHPIVVPEIVFPTSRSVDLANEITDVAYHEFGHHVQTDASSNALVLDPARTAHGGYYVNRSSNDAWVEGFATFFAAMMAKHGDRDGRLPAYRYTGGSEAFLEPDSRPWDGTATSEEFAVAGLLLDFEDGPADYTGNPDTVHSASVSHRVITTPNGARVIVGKVRGLSRGSHAFLRATLRGPSGRRTIPIWVDGSNAARRAGDDAVFWAVVPPGFAFDRVQLRGLQFEDIDDDDPLDVELADLWRTITTNATPDAKPGKPAGYGHIVDVDELHQVLAKAYGGKDADADGVDDVDQVFVNHGFFDDLDGDHALGPGEAIGRSGHPPLDAAGNPAGPGVSRTEPPTTEATRVRVDTGGIDASFVVFVTYPDARANDSHAYLARRDGDGRVSVLVPPPGSGATATVMALADGHLPEIVGTVAADEFWARAARAGGKPFLSYNVELQRGAVTLGSGGGSTRRVVLVGGGVLVLVAALRRKRLAREKSGV